MKHSELPWKVSGTNGVHCAKGPAVALLRHKDGSARHNAQENAAFIVKACNNHYKLLEALKYFKRHINGDASCDLQTLLHMTDEAIKEAE